MDRVCALCGVHFEAARGYMRFCSPDCRLKHRHLEKTGEKEAVPTNAEPFRCKWCGEYVVPAGRDLRYIFCSRKCAKKFWKKPRYGTGYHIVIREVY